jgi:hypothetical protein
MEKYNQRAALGVQPGDIMEYVEEFAFAGFFKPY